MSVLHIQLISTILRQPFVSELRPLEEAWSPPRHHCEDVGRNPDSRDSKQHIRRSARTRFSATLGHLEDAPRRVHRVLKHPRLNHRGREGRSGPPRGSRQERCTQARSLRGLRRVRTASAHRRQGMGRRLLLFLVLQGTVIPVLTHALCLFFSMQAELIRSFFLFLNPGIRPSRRNPLRAQGLPL